MKLTDHRDIDADRATVWAALFDPEVLKACVPGAQEMTGNVDEGYDAVVIQKVGPVKATFKGRVEIGDIVELDSCTITGEGKGGAAGFAKGGARVRLSDGEAGGTRLDYDVDAKVGGKLAQLGSRLIDGFAKKMADQFFENFKTVVEGPAEDETGVIGDAPAASVDADNAVREKRSWLRARLGRD